MRGLSGAKVSQTNFLSLVAVVAYLLFIPLLSCAETLDSKARQDLADLCDKGCRSRDQFAVLYTFAAPKSKEQVEKGVPLALIGIFARKGNILCQEVMDIHIDRASKKRAIWHNVGVFDGDTFRSWSSQGNASTISPGFNYGHFLVPTSYSRYIYFVHNVRLADLVRKSIDASITASEDGSITMVLGRIDSGVFQGTTVTLEPEWGYLPRSLSGFIRGRFTGSFEVQEVLSVGLGERKRVLPKRIVITPSSRTGSKSKITVQVIQALDLWDYDPSVLLLDFPQGALLTDDTTGQTGPIGDKHIESIPIELYPTVSSSLFQRSVSQIHSHLEELADSTPIQ